MYVIKKSGGASRRRVCYQRGYDIYLKRVLGLIMHHVIGGLVMIKT